ncbi:MAG: aminotransferase class III-fold pyridoxal phosphate-dependent enzyme [Acidobacteriota bacterium]
MSHREFSSMDVMTVKPPFFSTTEAERVANDIFGVTASAHSLGSERDQNFHLRTQDGRERVLKISNPAEDPSVIDFQIQALLHIERQDPSLPIPRMLKTVGGENSQTVEGSDGRGYRVRLVTYLPGGLLQNATHSPELMRDLGATTARLGQALRGFFHPAAGHVLPWDVKQAARFIEHVDCIEDAALRKSVGEMLNRFEAQILPQMPGLRAQVIHNDMHGGNTLVQDDSVTGIIDFGDMVHTALVSDVAVALSEAVQGMPDPITTAMEIVRGYCSVEPLTELELSLLFDLTLARLAMGITISSWRGKKFPDLRDQTLDCVPPYSAAFKRLIQINSDFVHGCFRDACGLPPDPALILSVPEEALNPPEPDLSRLLERRRAVLGPALNLSYHRPLHFVRARGAWLIDASGRAYLDAYNNVPHVGHCHPAVVSAIAYQAARLNTNTRYLYESIVDYAERLTATFPGNLRICTLLSSGSEANDIAWRLAKAYTGHDGAIVVEGAYHGVTDASNDLSPSELQPGAAGAPHVTSVPPPDTYRGRYRRDEPRAGELYAADVDAAIASLRAGGRELAMFMFDSILSSSGIMLPPEGYLAAVFEKVRAAGGLCVADEVQAGFGRTGDHMWGFEAHGVVPDIVTLGKAIGSGHPMAAVVTTPEIVAALAKQSDFFSTTGGNPVSCAAGMATLEVLEREGLMENARRVGAYLREGIGKLSARHALIGDVRGTGLYTGVELVRDRVTLEPAAEEAHEIVDRMRDGGVLIGWDGLQGNVLKIRPPMVFSKENADHLMKVFDKVLGSL